MPTGTNEAETYWMMFKGEWIPYSGIVTISEISGVDQSRLYPIQQICESSFSVECKVSRGMIDHIIGKQTMAAYRYRRSLRRQKEKERRRRLKEDRT